MMSEDVGSPVGRTVSGPQSAASRGDSCVTARFGPATLRRRRCEVGGEVGSPVGGEPGVGEHGEGRKRGGGGQTSGGGTGGAGLILGF